MQVTSTTYVDFLMRTGLSRLRVVKEARRQYEEGYAQGRDFYRPIREGIVTMHRANGVIDQLWQIVEDAPPAKSDSYKAAVKGYERWMRGKGIVWTNRPKPYRWTHGDLAILVNPELLMNVDGDPYRVKLYFKSHKVTQAGANLVIHLHESAGLAGENVAVLDVRNARLFTKTRTGSDYETVLRSEALSFAAMWHAVGAIREMPGDATS
jgi:hypothetical protein